MTSETTNTRLDTNSKSQLVRTVVEILSWHRTFAKFPLATEQMEEVIRHLLGPTARDYMLSLAVSHPRVLNWAHNFPMYVPDGAGAYRICHIPHTIPGHETSPVPNYNWQHKPPHVEHDTPYASELIQWVKSAVDIDNRIFKAEAIVQALVGHLGTYGQVLRMWPGVAQWLRDHSKLAASVNQVRRSSLPSEFSFMLGGKCVSLKQWEMKERLEEIDGLLATGIMVRAASGSDERAYRTRKWPGSSA